MFGSAFSAPMANAFSAAGPMVATHVAPGGCKMCGHPNADVRILPCGCSLHARCVPLNLIVSEAALRNKQTIPVEPGTLLCPVCRSSSVGKIQLHPLSSQDLDKAVNLRKEALQKKKPAKAAEDANFHQIQAETSYLLLSHNQGSGSVSSDHDYQRTGRWTEEEITYVDFLVEAFDSGRIPVEHGLKLNEFLSEVLLCKSSRLTKKMKNARLSIRSYTFSSPVPRLDVEVMSSLEYKFLESITSGASRLELKFNISRFWRSHMSNLCLQIGSSLLDANEWIASLEELERRATSAEERLRKARRRRMGLALKTDSKNDTDGIFFGGVPVHRPPKKAKTESKSLPPPVTSSAAVMAPSSAMSSNRSVGSTGSGGSGSGNHSMASSDDESDFISNMLDVGSNVGPEEDYTKILDDLAGGQLLIPERSSSPSNGGPFLQELITYVEEHELPFQHVDAWVPSYRQIGDKSQLRLFNAGFATRQDIDPSVVFQLDEYGEYSTRFSFASGVGLPGRVHTTGNPVWERNIDQADPNFFARAGGAKVYGVKTGFGFSLKTSIGMIVVTFYSTADLVEDRSLMVKCVSDLSRFCAAFSPEPRWKLVVDMAGAKESKQKPALQHPSDGISDDVSVHSAHSAPSFHAPDSTITEPDDGIEQMIASLLGEYMPLAGLAATGESSNATPAELAPHFMSLRLLLLRSRSRRSDEENEMVDIIKKSYSGYVADNRRDKRDVTMLVVRDWQFLKQTAAPAAPPSAPPPMVAVPAAAAAGVADSKPPAQTNLRQHQSHIMGPQGINAFPAAKAAPVMMPQALPVVNSGAVLPRSRSSSSVASQGDVANVNIVENT